MANLVEMTEKRRRDWIKSYRMHFKTLYSKYYLHSSTSPYRDPDNNFKTTKINKSQNLLNKSAEDFKTKISTYTFNELKDYKKKTIDLAIYFIISTYQTEEEQSKEISNVLNTSGDELITLLNVYYKLYTKNKKTILTYDKNGYADPKKNFSNPEVKEKIDQYLGDWVETVYSFDTKGEDYSSVLDVIKKILNNSKKDISQIKTKDLEKDLNNYLNTIKNNMISNNEEPIVQEAIISWIKDKNEAIKSTFKWIRQNYDIEDNDFKMKKNKGKIRKLSKKNGNVLNIKANTVRQSYRTAYKKAGILSSAQQVGEVKEIDVSNFFDDITIEFKKERITTKSEHVGAKKLNLKTRTTDVAVLLPEFDIQINGNDNKEVVMNGNRQIINFSVKNSTPEEANPWYETRIRSMTGLNNAFEYLEKGLKNISKGENYKNNAGNVLETINTATVKYFFVNEIFTENSSYIQSLKDFLGAAGEFYQFALGQFNETIYDKIDFMIINDTILPSGYISKLMREYAVNNNSRHAYSVKIEAEETLADDFGPLYSKSYDDTQGKNIMSKSNIYIDIHKNFRKEITELLIKTTEKLKGGI